MKFGLSTSEFELLKRIVIDPLKQQGCKIWIFGSRATGNHKAFSDIDLLYELSKPMPQGFLSNLKEELENSRLNYKVDLVEVSDLAESYKESVFKDRIQI